MLREKVIKYGVDEEVKEHTSRCTHIVRHHYHKSKMAKRERAQHFKNANTANDDLSEERFDDEDEDVARRTVTMSI